MRTPPRVQVGGATAVPVEEGATPASSASPGPGSFLNGGRNRTSSAGANSSSNNNGARDPAERDGQNKTSTRIAALIFFKGLFGAGLLALPGAFASVGLPLALLIFALVSAICLGTMLMLLECRRLVREERGVWVESYEELAGEVFGLRAYRATQVVMSVLTLIYCSGFVIVITSSLAAVLPLSRALVALIIFPVLTGLAWLPFMRDLWIVSIFGLLVYLVGVVGATVWYSAEHYEPPPDAMAWRWKGLPHFFGVAVYALEGINLTLPVCASMRSIRKPPHVMTIGVMGFATVVAFYAGFAYKAGVGSGCDIVTDCLGDGRVVNTVRVALALSLIATHPVYLIVASEIFERAFFGGAEDAEEREVMERIDADFHHFHDHEQAPLAAAAAAAQQQQENRRSAPVPMQTQQPTQTQQQAAAAAVGGSLAAASRAPCLAGGRMSDVAKGRVLRTAEVALTCLVGGSVASLGSFTSLVGATLVTFIGFLLPTAMWVSLQRASHGSHAEALRTYGIAAVIITAGLVAMVVGTVEGIRGLAHTK